MGGNKEILDGATGPLSPHFLPIFPHFPPFFLGSFPHFPPFFLGSFHQCVPPHSLVANLNLDFWPFQPLNFPFFHQAIWISLIYPHFPPFFLPWPISRIVFR